MSEKNVANCLFCKKEMEEAMRGSLKSFQPCGGGEVRFIFSYGSEKFDDFAGRTEFRGFICDDCGEKFTPEMKKSGYGFGD